MYTLVRFALFCLTLFCLARPASGQQKQPPPAAPALSLAWENLENHYQNTDNFRSAFTLTNTGKKALPASGWTLYFNLARKIDAASVTGGAAITQVNGDLFALTPTAAFRAVPPGGTVRIEFTASEWAINFTDGPTGPYWVWAVRPEQGFLLKNYTIQPFTLPQQYRRSPSDRSELPTAASIFRQNESVQLLPVAHLPRIVPTPNEMTARPEQSFLLDATVTISPTAAFLSEANYLSAELGKALGGRPLTQAGAKTIVLQQDASLKPEAYRLSIENQQITIAAVDGAGIFYGIQSLKMLFPPDAWVRPQTTISLPGLSMQDAPRFGYRGLMLDVARNFQPKAEVLKMLEIMSLYKLNVLHFHFCEDECWRLEIPGLPELTTVGATRGHGLPLPPSFGSGPTAGQLPGSGFYTRQDFIDILRFATARHIRVIPEIETPGHARAAIRAMEARYHTLKLAGRDREAEEFLLQEPDDASQYRSVQGWDDNVLCVALPSVYRFLDKVSDEIIAMYREAGAPLETIHLGGDEVPAGVWERSPASLKLLVAHPEWTGAYDLWYYYFGKMDSLWRSKGLYVSGWEEAALLKTMLDGEPYMIPNPDFATRNFHPYVWNNVAGWGGEDWAYRLANSGYKVVLSCVTNLYFDLAYSNAPDEPGYYWGGFVGVEKPFYFIPYDYFKNVRENHHGEPIDPAIFTGKDRLTDFGKSNIVGLQGHLWSENLITTDRLEYMALPKMLALAERAWAADPAWATGRDPAQNELLYREAWNRFANDLGQRELARLDGYNGGYAYRIPPPGIRVENGAVRMNVQFPGLTIRYTTDGSVPTTGSAIYTAPFRVGGAVVKAATFDSRGRRSGVSELRQ